MSEREDPRRAARAAAKTEAKPDDGPPAQTSYRVDNSRWPLSLHRSPTVMRDADVERMIAEIDDLLRRREAHALVLELEDRFELSPVLRRRLAEQLEARHDAIARYCRGIAVIARTPASRGVHTALRWLAPAPCAERLFAGHPEAEQWALARARGESS